jgi:hypothetical protein
MYDFAGQSQGEMTVKKGDVIIVVRKEPNGKLGLDGLIVWITSS